MPTACDGRFLVARDRRIDILDYVVVDGGRRSSWQTDDRSRPDVGGVAQGHRTALYPAGGMPSNGQTASRRSTTLVHYLLLGLDRRFPRGRIFHMGDAVGCLYTASGRKRRRKGGRIPRPRRPSPTRSNDGWPRASAAELPRVSPRGRTGPANPSAADRGRQAKRKDDKPFGWAHRSVPAAWPTQGPHHHPQDRRWGHGAGHIGPAKSRTRWLCPSHREHAGRAARIPNPLSRAKISRARGAWLVGDREPRREQSRPSGVVAVGCPHLVSRVKVGGGRRCGSRIAPWRRE